MGRYSGVIVTVEEQNHVADIRHSKIPCDSMLVDAGGGGAALRARRKERSPRRYADRDELLLQKPLGVLNGTLIGREHLLGNDFTVADLNLAAILCWAKIAGLDFSTVPEVDRWLDACLARPANARVRDMAKA